MLIDKRLRSHQPMLFEPSLQPIPSVLGLLLSIAGSVVSMKSMGRIGIDNDPRGTFRRLQRLLHLLDRIYGDAWIIAPIEAEHRSLETSRQVQRMLRLKFARLTG